MSLEIGMRVECCIQGHNPGVPDVTDVGYIIGEPKYSDDWSHVVIANEQMVGMPVAACWCKPIASGCGDAIWMRNRYEKLCPGFLKPDPKGIAALTTA